MDANPLVAPTNLITDAIQYLGHGLPAPVSVLEASTHSIPDHLRSAQLLRKIFSLNKKLILEEFEALSSSIASLFVEKRLRQNNSFRETLLIVIDTILVPYKNSGSYYAQQVASYPIQEATHSGPETELCLILTLTARAHYDHFELSKSEKSMMTMARGIEASGHSLRIPEKFSQIINSTVHDFIPPGLREREENELESEVGSEVQQNAGLIRNTLSNNLFMAVDTDLIKYPDLQMEGESPPPKQGAMELVKKTTMQLLSLAEDRYKKYESQKKKSQMQKNDNECQDKVNMLVMAIESANTEQVQPRKQVLSDLFGLEGSNTLSFYEVHMIAHLSNLIMRESPPFDFTNLKYNPYLQVLISAISEELFELRKDFTELTATMSSRPQKTSEDNTESTYFGRVFEKFSNQYSKGKAKPYSALPLAREECYPQLIKLLEEFQNSLKGLPQSQQKENKFMPKILKELAQDVEARFHLGEKLNQYHEVQSWIIIAILLYQGIGTQSSTEYSPMSRRSCIRILRRIFNAGRKNNLFNFQQPPLFRNWPVVLKYLENHREQVVSQKRASDTCEEAERILQFLIKNIDDAEVVGENLADIFKGGLQQFRNELPKMKFVCLSGNQEQSGPQCKVVHLFISGFLSEDTDKLEEWADLVDIMPDSEIYSLIWQSNTIKNLVRFMLQTTKEVLLSIHKARQKIKEKYSDNPFNPAFTVSQITGRMLAELVLRLFPGRFVNIIGYSLGTEVIKEFMGRMVQTKRLNNINNVYLMGGVSDVQGYTEIIAQSERPLSVYNCYTSHDSVLKHLLSMCKPEISPIGLQDMPMVPGHSITNIDCTKFISGHLAFRSNLEVMGEVLEMSLG